MNRIILKEYVAVSREELIFRTEILSSALSQQIANLLQINKKAELCMYIRQLVEHSDMYTRSKESGASRGYVGENTTLSQTAARSLVVVWHYSQQRKTKQIQSVRRISQGALSGLTSLTS